MGPDWKPSRADALTFVPDGKSTEEALLRTTHLGIGAHQDDLETIAIPGILRCWDQEDLWFSGIVVSNGAGAPRSEDNRSLSSLSYINLRNEEQKNAASVGRYSIQILLNHPSTEVKNAETNIVQNEIKKLLTLCKPDVLYTHNPLDSHPTHVAVCLRTIQGIRQLPFEKRPKTLYGMSFWRSLEWINDEDLISFDCSQRIGLQTKLLEVFRSQNSVKNYAEAVLARRKSNATFSNFRLANSAEYLTYGIDLTALIQDDKIQIKDFLLSKISTFQQEVSALFEQIL